MSQVWNWIASKRPQSQQIFLPREEILNSLHRLCMPPNAGQPTHGLRIPEKNVRGIRIYLQALDSKANRLDEERWSLRPRLYAILHRIGATQLLDDFIRHHITDFNLPFNEQTLPAFVTQDTEYGMRYAFFAVQDYYLTDVKDIESEKSKHLTLPISGDTYFVPERPLGHGSFGGVDLVFSRLSTEWFARKRVLRRKGSEQSQRYLIQELRELRRLSHRHLVQIIGSYTDIHFIAYLMKPVAESTLEEFLGGSQQLKNPAKLILRRFYGCLSGAMNYLHINHIRHRDLSARNILIDARGEVYISDFGSSYNWESKPTSRTKHRDVPTSPDYMAPELARGGEHGTKSDMWSLGIVFLEMTSKLLNHRPSEMRSKMRDNDRSQPYPYSNVPILNSWIQTLGKANADFDHDREPLSWIRELLHVEQEHRLTPSQLMKYILESPSFGVFCCMSCQDDFQNDAFAYGPVGPSRKDSTEDPKDTRAAVEELLRDPSSEPFRGMSIKRTDSIKQWLEDSSVVTDPLPAELSAVRFDGEWGDNDLEDNTNPIDAEQFLQNTYDFELYHPRYRTDDQREPPVWSDHANQLGTLDANSSTEPAELLGDIDWGAENTDQVPQTANRHQPVEERVLHDSGLGFLEYMSNSSDDDRPLQPFEEESDRSTVDSDQEPDEDESSCTGPLQDPLKSMFQYTDMNSRHAEDDIAPDGRGVDGELLFDEEVDKSDAENPFDESPDHSECGSEKAESVKGQSSQGIPATVESVSDGDPVMKGDQDLETNISYVPESSFEPGPGLITTVEPEKIYQDHTSVGEQSVENRPPAEEDEQQNLTAIWRGSGAKKPKKKARISENVEHFTYRDPENSTYEHEGENQPPALPVIIIEDVDGTAAGASEASPESSRPPLSPRKQRELLVPVDVTKLMNNTWEMASSAATSVMSENTKSRISKFFFMIPNEAQVSSVLAYNCKIGSASAVRTILQKVTSPKKALRHRQFFVPLLHAVSGASSRHNKCVRELLLAGVNPNHKSRRTGLTPLHMALAHPDFKGYTNLVFLLLSNNADPNARDANGEVPLSKLFLGPDTEPLEPHKRGALAMLLKEGAKPDCRLPGTGNTPLHLAVRRKDRVATAMLLHMGADVDARNNSGSTPLQITANQFRLGELSADHAEVLDHLLQYKPLSLDAGAGALGRTALHWAVLAGCAEAVGRLLEAGADVGKEDAEGVNAMGLAIRSAEKLTMGSVDGDEVAAEMLAQHAEIMTGLVKHGSLAWAEQLKTGKCAVETAVKRKDGGKLLKELIKLQLDKDRRFRGGTVGEFAEREGTRAAKRLLIGNG